jgi:hypothetical protein
MIELIGEFLNLQERGYGQTSLAILVTVALATYWLLNKSKAAKWFSNGEDVVPPFISLPAILFALLITALASDVWQKHGSAKDAVIKEAAALRSMMHISQQLGDQGALIEKSTKDYINAVITQEWPAMTKADHAHKESAFAALQSLDSTVSRIASNSKLPEFTAQRLQTALDTIQVSRLQRISLAHDAISIAKWAAAIVLAVLNLVTIAIVHIRKPRAMAISMALSILCIMATIHVLSLNRSPFVGTAAISSNVLVESLKVFEKR